MKKRKELRISEKIRNIYELDIVSQCILSEIESLSKLEMGCFISNNGIAELFGISLSTAKRKVQELKHLGYIEVIIKKKADNTSLRIIKMTNKLYEGGRVKMNPPQVKMDQEVGSKRTTICTSLPKGREMYNKNSQNQKSLRDSDLRKKKPINKNYIDGKIYFLLEDKIGNEKTATMIYANMRDDDLIPSKEDMKYLINEMTKEELIKEYGSYRV